MPFNNLTMKKILVLLIALTASVGFQSCNQDGEDEDFPVAELVGTYVGAMNVQNPDFSSAQYTVTVTQVSSTTVRITPSTGVATEWTPTLSKILGIYTCVGCVTQNQVTFTSLSSGIELAYNYGNNEQFAGVKQ